MGFRRAAAIDANQPAIVKALRRCGAYVLITSQLKNAFDLLVIFQGKTYIVEIKDGIKPPSARRLSEGEEKCRHEIESRGVRYHIINSVDEALLMLNS